MKAIRVASEPQFERLRKSIDSQASEARTHWNLLKGLDAASNDYYSEMELSRTFWHLTFIAHMEAVISRLCRLYDKHEGALSLGRFLLTIRENRAFFSDAAFKERLVGNPHAESLAENRSISDAELNKEISSVSGSDPLVVRLWSIRDKVISHTDAEVIRRDQASASRFWLPPEDIEELLRRAAGITHKYSLLYDASLDGGIWGTNDYRSTFQWLRRGLSAHRAEVETEIQQITSGSPFPPRFARSQ